MKKTVFTSVVIASLIFVLTPTIRTIKAMEPPPKTGTFFEEVNVYNEPTDDQSTTPIATLAPQTVTLVYENDGAAKTIMNRSWYRIQTWLGVKWITPENMFLREETTETGVTNMLLSAKETPLYDKPSKKFPSGQSLSVQIIKPISYWGGYFKIDTWEGVKWVEGINIHFYDVEPKQIELKSETPFSFQRGQPAAGTLSPQVVTTYQQAWNYYLIETWLGFAWIQLEP
ncbi:hypothetical protein [Paenibacillus sp. N3.4]|uniref:hypothetical protein n=1 Tax=Paenibacillus sp. N3.4 TaxID=2603222 RepID=UPI0011CB136E|nr:hypothetical protein [Paenibacillus sp. N3.4]TXK83726.1 hypothetical protein FU659_12500 [Paenibacillus sp. N3.4]